MSKPHPRLFAPEMVRSILGGHKSQTRRLLLRHNSLVDGTVASKAAWEALDWSTVFMHLTAIDGAQQLVMLVWSKTGNTRHVVRPRVEVGDYFWGREAWRSLPRFDATKPVHIPMETGVWYEADRKPTGWEGWGKLRPSMFMPYWMCRLHLPVTEIRPQLLQDISERDCLEEGIERVDTIVDTHCAGGFHQEVHEDRFYVPGDESPHENGVEAYAALWDAINGQGKWAKNPLVWAYTFTRKAA